MVLLEVMHGIAEEKLDQISLPDPLRQSCTYFAGNWPGENWLHSAFAFQDCLIPFELLTIEAL